MKKSTIKLFHFSILLAGLVFATVSCKKDEKTPDRDKFLGTYSVVQDCSGQTNTYDMTIAASATSENEVTIQNLYALGKTLTATVSGDNLTISSQVVSNVTYSGSGPISGDVLTLDFTIGNGAASVTCTAVCTKK